MHGEARLSLEGRSPRQYSTEWELCVSTAEEQSSQNLTTMPDECWRRIFSAHGPTASSRSPTVPRRPQPSRSRQPAGRGSGRKAADSAEQRKACCNRSCFKTRTDAKEIGRRGSPSDNVRPKVPCGRTGTAPARRAHSRAPTECARGPGAALQLPARTFFSALCQKMWRLTPTLA